MSGSIIIERKDFLAAITAVLPAVARQRTTPHRHGARLVIEGGDAWIEATSQFLTLQAPLPGTVNGKGSAVVYANALRTAVARGLPSGPVTLNLRAKRPSVTAGATTVWLDTLPADAWLMPASTEGDELVLTAEDIATIRRVAIVASNDWARPILRTIELANGTACATDSYRLSVGDLSVTPVRPVLLPLDVARVLPTDGVTLRVSADALGWGTNADGGQAPLLVVDNKIGFPNWRPLFPTDDPAFTLSVERQPFLAAVLRAEAVVGSKRVDPLVIEQALGGIRLGVTNEGDNLFAESVAGVIATGSPISVAVNARFLAELLRSFTGNRVRIGIWDSLKPLFLANDDDDSQRSLLMPIRAVEAKRQAA